MDAQRESARRLWFNRPVEPPPTDQEAEVRATLYAPPAETERTVLLVSAERRMRPAA
ncbi:MAG TPA: hypothetical protein VID68_06530 [Solirubrobacteraceae bacterium]|jgi:hypothetical protein